ncbi:MAG: DedA family protein [Sporolactobacillus sp.]
MSTLQNFVITYGYIALYLILLLALAGIPCAEESLLFLVGALLTRSGQDAALRLTLSILSAALGASSGMVGAYLIGYYIGKPFLMKYGCWIGLTKKRWSHAESIFIRHAFTAVCVGYFIPGARQLNPYLAGISKLSFRLLLPASLIGALLWSSLCLVSGYFLGSQFVSVLQSGWTDSFAAVIILCTGIIFWWWRAASKKNA